MTEDEKLLRNLKKRRRGSLEKAIEIYTPYVSVIVYNIIGAFMQKEDVEEVVSDVFVSLWRRAEYIDGEKGSIRTYLGAAARNHAKNKLRSAAVCEELNENIIDSGEAPEAALEKKEERERLINLIRELGEPDGEIFFRYYFYEEKISKISAETGLCTSTVTSKLSRGRKKLREILRRVGYEQEI